MANIINALKKIKSAIYGEEVRGAIYDSIFGINDEVEKKAPLPLKGGSPDVGTEGHVLRSKGDGSTYWSNIGQPTDAQTASAVTAWLNAHPEATTTVQDKTIKNSMLTDNISNVYLSAITQKTYRKHDTTIYVVRIPKNDENGNLIDPYIYMTTTEERDAGMTPTRVAQEQKTDVTFNGAVSYYKADKTWTTGSIFSRGKCIYEENITGDLMANTAGYLNIKKDRSYSVENIKSTRAQLAAAGAYNLTEFYYPLVIGGNRYSLTSVLDNEGEPVVGARHPYISLGVAEDGTIIIIACDGRSDHEKGLTPEELQEEMISEGAEIAVMMDGGGSTSLSYRGTKLNKNIDGGGTVDRMIRFTFNVKNDSVNNFLGDAFGWIGAVKQQIREELYKAVADARNVTGFSYEYDAVHQIEANEDVNEMTAIGRYTCQLPETAETLKNCPTSQPFVMTVEFMNGTEFFHTIKDYNGDMYLRRDHYYSNAHHFSAWKKATQ